LSSNYFDGKTNVKQRKPLNDIGRIVFLDVSCHFMNGTQIRIYSLK
jgi:hypothetical protein